MIREKDFIWTLKDVDGLTINSTTYYSGNAQEIDLCVTNASVSWKIKTDPAEPNTGEITDTYAKRIGVSSQNGFLKKVYSLDCVIDSKEETTPSLGLRKLDWTILHDLALFNHPVYLKDYSGSETGVSRMIDFMKNEAAHSAFQQSIYYKLNTDTIYTTNGAKVVLSNISSINPELNSDFNKIKLEFTETGSNT